MAIWPLMPVSPVRQICLKYGIGKFLRIVSFKLLRNTQLYVPNAKESAVIIFGIMVRNNALILKHVFFSMENTVCITISSFTDLHRLRKDKQHGFVRIITNMFDS